MVQEATSDVNADTAELCLDLEAVVTAVESRIEAVSNDDVKQTLRGLVARVARNYLDRDEDGLEGFDGIQVSFKDMERWLNRSSMFHKNPYIDLDASDREFVDKELQAAWSQAASTLERS